MSTLQWLLVVSLVGVLPSSRQARLPTCTIRCGIVEEQRSNVKLSDYVSYIWRHIQNTRTVNGVQMVFVPIKSRARVTLDEINAAYMDIGTANVSILLGAYKLSIATGAEKFSIPYWTMTTIEDTTPLSDIIFSALPSPADIFHVSTDVVDTFGWTSIAVFYDSPSGAKLLEELVRRPDVHVRAWMVDQSADEESLRASLLRVRQLSVTSVITVTRWPLTTKILEVALHLSMLTSRYSWLIATLNEHHNPSVLNYSYTQVNLTTFHLPQPQVTMESSTHAHFTTFEYAAIYDTLLTLYNSMRIHRRDTGGCRWSGPQDLKNTLPMVSDTCASGDLRFNTDGKRTGYLLDVLSLAPQGLTKIGVWNSSVADPGSKLNIKNIQRKPVPPEYPLGRAVVPVVTLIEAPFVTYKSDHQLRQGNDRFEGFCVDLLKEVADMVGFRYRLYEVEDGLFGDEVDGNWTGLVGDIYNGKASMAMASLTITSKREKVIDFTKPFKTRGISIVMKKPPQDSTFFQFTAPLSPLVWVLLAAVLVFVSLTLYVVDKLAPHSDPCVRFDGPECVWFVFASMVLSGTDVIPRTISGRLLAATLWFFSLIIISSYTANLAAFLTVSKFHTNIKTVADLLNQNEVQYGTVSNTEVSEFFQNNNLSNYAQMWYTMTILNPSSIVKSSDEGFRKVKESKADYAFLWDSPVIKHKVLTDCELMEVGKTFDSRGYAIGVPAKVSYREQLSMAVLKLSENGVIYSLEAKWWNDTQCADEERPRPSKTTSLSVHKVGGVFVVLAAGMVVALVAGLIQFYRQKRSRREKKIESAKSTELNGLNRHSNSITEVDVPRQQLEEPFLANTCTVSKHTNIF